MNRLLYTGRIVVLLYLVAAVFIMTPGRGTGPNAAPSADDTNLKDELIKQDIRMHDALPRGFTDVYESWTEDYTEINETGEILSKAEVRARYRASANRRPNIPPDEHAAHISQDTIVMTHVLKRNGLKNDKDGYKVVPTVYAFRVSHVFVKRGGRWRMMSTQWTPIAPTQTE